MKFSNLAACDNGDAVFEPGTGEISQICYNRRYYHVVETKTIASQNQTDQRIQNFQSDGKSGNNERTAAILGALFGISILAIIVIILVSMILLIRLKKRNQQQHAYEVPSDK